MSLRIFFIFIMCFTLNSLLFAARYGSFDYDPTRRISLTKHAPLQEAHTTPSLEDGMASVQRRQPRVLDDVERSILFEHKALQSFSSQTKEVYLYFEVKKEGGYLMLNHTYCDYSPAARPFISLRLANESGFLVRKFSLYDALRVGFLRCIKDGIIQKTPFYSPELGVTIAAHFKRRQKCFDQKSDTSLPDVSLTDWKNNRKNPDLCYVATDAQCWLPGVVRIVVGETALTGFWPDELAPLSIRNSDDGSAFFEAVKGLQSHARTLF